MALPVNNSTSTKILCDEEASLRASQQASSSELYSVLQAAIETGLILVGLMFIALLLPRQAGWDGILRYDDLVSLLSAHRLYQPHSRYSLIGPLFSSPLVGLGMRLGNPVEWACLTFCH
jgi:hypothetical protein